MAEANMTSKRPSRRGHGPNAMMVAEKAKDFKGTFIKLVKYLGKYKITIILVMIFAICSTVFSIIGPKVMGDATQKIYEGLMNIITNSGGMDYDGILRTILLLLGLYVLSALFSYMQGWLMSGVANKVSYQMRKELAAKIHKLPLSFYDKTSYGEVLSRITNDVDTLSNSLNQSLTQIVTSLTTVIGVLYMMFSISWQMACVALLVLPISMIFISVVVKRSQGYFVSQQEYLGHVNGHIEEMYGAHIIVKAYNGEEKSTKQFEKLNNSLYESGWKSQFMSGLMMPIMSFIGNVGYVAICVLGGYYASIGVITVGNIQSFISYMRSFTQPLTQVANISNVLQQTMASSERIFEFLSEEEEEPDTQHPLNVENIKGDVIFAHVKFGYQPDNIVIHDFTADIKQGQKVAIVGPTGAGKTTIVKLLMRFYELNEGAICIDGLDIRQFTRNDLRSLFGMVLQDTWSYSASIADNIRYGKLDATDEEVVQAAKAAQVDHFIKTLPDGYNSILNEDANNISQGQKQLLTIARAILTDPKILILDEATSSVDTRTEILIQKAMDNLMKGRTSFIIAHRLSTIRDADLILCMDHGDIVEQGRHEELLEKKGFYYRLYNSQFEHEEE
ncbi:ABC transporter ATP-binding protein [uncultured Traorella sp.]|uniref:ABC transporter ATP-binding protein n=1 Tax=uncultured Traorella sp. TaxID=1929048 RepID=UPI0025E947DB|nr:ABC transporter ATP-binding protein [uncultured Traorella sp.]